MLFVAVSPRKQPYFFCEDCKRVICDDNWTVTPMWNGDNLVSCDNCGQFGITVLPPVQQPPDAIGV